MSTLALDLAIKASVVLAVAALVDLVTRRRGSAATRHFVWTMTVLALLVLPLAVAALPAWSVHIPVPAAVRADVADAITRAPFTISRGASAPLAVTAAPAQPASAIAARRSFDPIWFAFALYSAGVAFLLARLVIGQFALRRLIARSEVVVDGDSIELARTCARQLQIRRPVRLLRADDEVMPFTFGTRHAAIVLPSGSARWSTERRTAVILHELAHVARADCLAQRFAALACALYWPHPGVWLAARRLRVEREFACDDRVITAGTVAREYAGHLLEIAHAFRGVPAPAPALGMARARQLEQRLLAVIDDDRNRRPLTRRLKLAAAVVSCLLLVPIAALQAKAVPRNAEVLSAGTPGGVPRAGLVTQNRDRSDTQEFAGTWELRPSGRPGMVYVSLRTTHSQNGTTVPMSRFEGLNEPGMTAAIRGGRIVDGTVHFVSRRDAGAFTFDGVCRSQMCGGTYSFAPDPAFPSRIAKYGLGAPTPQEQYRLAMADVGVTYIEGIKAEGYALPDVHTLVRAAEHGVSLDYVKGMSALGYKLGALEPLVRMRDHGVDPDYVKGMAAQGFPKLEADELVRLRDHGVDPEYVKGMRDIGYKSADVADFVKARDHGVDPEFARAVASSGYKDVPVDTLIHMRDHGVDPEYVRGLADAGYKNVSIDMLVRMRDHGVDPEYARGLAGLGYKDLPIDSMIRMRDHGVDLDYIRRLQQRGVTNLSVDDLIRRRDRGDDGR
ncbi:MAG TPA: M56 family metallopeptidase [Vicinamibacterales bacterium]|jgi:beta-lactamase regulating signal transducer with metallopeptidase domain|nr:M56 family metallopeptidase [Vicinamibacterales bacterium]